MKITLKEDIQSPFVAREKILPKGRTFEIDDETANKLIADKKAKPATKAEELKQKVKDKTIVKNAMADKEEIEKR